MFSKDRFIQLIKQANVIHWDAQKSKMASLITLIPANGFLSKAVQINVQRQIWPVVADPVWQQKKKKYKKALLYMLTEMLGMPPRTAERVLLKKGEMKIGWQERVLPIDWQFSHGTTVANLTELDPYRSTEFCYPHNDMWYGWPANEFVFCRPELDQRIHKQKILSTFGAPLKFTIPAGTPYVSNVDIAHASGEIAFYHKLRLVNGRATALPPL
jgi:hypothetical protein